MKTYSSEELVNIGTGEDITIAEFARVVAATIGYSGEMSFDTSRPDGTPRKLLDVGRLFETRLARADIAEGRKSSLLTRRISPSTVSAHNLNRVTSACFRREAHCARFCSRFFSSSSLRRRRRGREMGDLATDATADRNRSQRAGAGQRHQHLLCHLRPGLAR